MDKEEEQLKMNLDLVLLLYMYTQNTRAHTNMCTYTRAKTCICKRAPHRHKQMEKQKTINRTKITQLIKPTQHTLYKT